MRLYLLKPDFTDPNLEPPGRQYFCPSCATVNGMLSYYPQLREKIEVVYVDFERPRRELIDLLGDANQSCPVLLLDGPSQAPGAQMANARWFINEPDAIVGYLSAELQVGFPHP